MGDEDPGRPANDTMADVAFENLKLVGPTKFGEEARSFAREVQKISDCADG